MTNPTFRDIQLLSTYLDGQLSPVLASRLESRLASDRALSAVLADLRFSRTMLRRAPQRRAPRNFTLSPKTAGIRAPLPRAVPAFSWASAVAALFFIFTAGASLLKGVAATSYAPMMAAEAPGMGGGGAEGYGGGPVEETVMETPATKEGIIAESTPMADTFLVPEASNDTGMRTIPPDEPAVPASRISVWTWFLLALAVLFLCLKLLIRWTSQQIFKRRIRGS